MSWQLTLAACAAANLKPGLPPIPDPLAPAIVEWDASKLPATLALSNGNIDVESTGANNVDAVSVASKAILPGAGKVYFEIEIVSLGAATNKHSVGLTSDLTSILVESYLNNNKNPGCCYFSDGQLYTASTSIATGLGNLTAGVVVGFVVDAAAGKVWIYINNVLKGSGADLAAGVPTCYIRAGQAYFPAVIPKDNTDKMRLLSIASQFTYTPPAGTTPYGNDNVNFSDHYLAFENGVFIKKDYYSGGYSFARWSEDAAGSAHSGLAIGDGKTTFFAAVWAYTMQNTINPISNYGNSYPAFTAFPTTAGKTWGTIYQEFTLDSRFDSLVDNSEYALRVSEFVGSSNEADFVNYNASFVVTFYDAAAALISTTESDKLLDNGTCVKHTRFIDVPPLTRTIRVGFKQYKKSADTTNDGNSGRIRGFNRQAALVRKVPLAKMQKASSGLVLLGRPNDNISMNKARVFIIITPP